MSPLPAPRRRHAALLLWLCCGASLQGVATAASSIRGVARTASIQARVNLSVSTGGDATAAHAQVPTLPPQSVMRCATGGNVTLKSHLGTYLGDEEYLGGWVGNLLGTTLTLDATAPGFKQQWMLSPATGNKYYLMSDRGKYLTDAGGSADVSDAQGAAEEWEIQDAGNGKVYLVGVSGQSLENLAGDISMDPEVINRGSVQQWEITKALDSSPACVTLGNTGGATPPADEETIAPGYCVNFNEGGSVGRGASLSNWQGVTDPEECFQKCRNDPLCLQAVYEQEGPAGPQCWTGVNSMAVKPAQSRPGAKDHCMAKLGFQSSPDKFTKLGKGTCPMVGFYSGNNAADAANINICQAKCLSESECKYISFKQGVTCSRFHGGTGTCNPLEADDTMTSFRRDPASNFHYFPMGAGKCVLGWYTDGSDIDFVDLAACQTKCSLEAQCKFVAFNPGKACSRFTGAAAPCLTRPTGKADHTTYRKDSHITSGIVGIAPPPRGQYRTSFGRCVHDEFVAKPFNLPAVNALPCYVDCLKFKASYAPRMCSRMCVNALVERGIKPPDADTACRQTCPAACDKVWIAPYVCPAPTTTPPPAPPAP